MSIVWSEMFLDEMRDDLGIGFGRELVAFLGQLLFQAEIVLDDSVVHHDDPSGAVAMRMRILLSRPAMGCPSSVSDAVSPVQRMFLDRLFQVAEFAFCAADFQAISVARNRNSCRIVTAIFQPPKPVKNDGNDTFLAYVPDNAAHGNLK